MLSHFQTRNCLLDLNYRNCHSEADQHLVPLTQSWQGPGLLHTPGPHDVLPLETIKETVMETKPNRSCALRGNKTVKNNFIELVF